MRKFTFLIALMVCTIGFGQTEVISDLGDNNPTYVQKKTNNQVISLERSSAPSILSNTQGVNNPVSYKQATAVYQNPLQIQEELAAYANYRATNPVNNEETLLTTGAQNRSMADIIPTAGATETFNPAVGDNLYDPGGPGVNYPNCDCITTSTLAGVTEVNFTEYELFLNFDWLAIYDSADTTGTVLWDSGPGGANESVDDLPGMIAANGSSTFIGTSGALTFEFRASAVVDMPGFTAEVITLGGGGGGGGPCNLVGPGNAFENGKSCTQNLGRIVAHDFTVPDGENSTITDFVASVFIGPTGGGINAAFVDVYVYDDAGGTPGAIIASELGVIPTSQVVTGTNFGFDVWDVALDIADVVLPGTNGSTTTYWVGISLEATDGSNNFWENSTAGGIGFGEAYDDGLGGGFVIDGTLEGVYTINADCTPIGGGGGPCDLVGPGNAFENGKSCTQNLGRIVAHDFTVPDGEDTTITDFVASVFIGATGSGVNAAFVDVYVYDDAGGTPGAIVASELGVIPTSQVVTGSNFGFDVWDVAIDIADVVLPGTNGSTTSYWIGISLEATDGSNNFWENSTAGGIGFGEAYDDGLGGGFVIDGTLEGVYTFTAICTPIGGGPSCVDVTYVAGNLPFDIDGAGNQTADCVNAPNLIPVTVNGVGTIGTDSNIDNVTLTITHTFDGDLDISLVAPSGAELLLSGGNGGGGDNFIDTVFMDGGGPLSGGAPPYTGTFEPDGGTFAAAFAGEAITGDWNLKICDNFGGDTGTVDAFSITICSPPPADNDTCADAFPIACGDVVVSETITNTDTGGNPAPDEWYSFTGTGTPQVVTLSLCDGGTDYDSFLRVFDACGGTEIAANDDSCGLQSELSFLSDGTSTYYIMVEGFASNSGNFSLEVTCVDPPPNDECTGAISMSCGETVVGETDTATFDASAPVCVTNISAPGVWYEFTDATGLVTNYTLSMCDGGTDYDSKITVYSGDCGALACVVDNDDTCGLQSEVSWQGDGLTTYYILVHGFAANTGNFSMALTCAPVPPPNDMIANSIDVDEIGFPYTDPAVAMPAATTEAGTPAGCDNAGAKGVWYNFVPDGDGFATAEIITPGTASTLFSVNNGPLAGDYVAVAGGFGGAIPNTPLTEDTALVIDADTTGDENDACDPIINGASLAGKIAVLRRGSCEFGFKALSAQNEGAIAVIVVNNVPDDPIVMGGGADGDDVTIPVVMVYDVDGEAIISELEGGGTVNVSLSSNPAGFSSVTFYTAPDENSIETDLTLVDWPGNQCVPGTSAIIPTTAGQAYYVYVTNGAITDIVIDGENLGVSDNTIEGFSYYPNPTDGILNLNAVDNIDDVAIYNLLGQQVLNQTIRATSAELNVSNLAVGAYIMKVSINGEIGTYKIIKR